MKPKLESSFDNIQSEEVQEMILGTVEVLDDISFIDFK